MMVAVRMALDNMGDEYFGNGPAVVELVLKMVLFDNNFMPAVFSDFNWRSIC